MTENFVETTAQNFVETTALPDTGVAFLTLNRPEQRNPLSSEAMRDVTAALRKLGDDDTTRVVVIRLQDRCSPRVTT